MPLARAISRPNALPHRTTLDIRARRAYSRFMLKNILTY